MKHGGRVQFVILATAPLAGCSGHQSVLNPMGPEAFQLAQLSWYLFAAGALVLLIVVVAIAGAIRGPAWSAHYGQSWRLQYSSRLPFGTATRPIGVRAAT